MAKCDDCGKEFPDLDALDSHVAGHAVRKVRECPLSYLLVLPDGVTTGRWEAADAFVDAYSELREKHPQTKFNYLPFSYKTYGDGKDPALDAILAIET
jgi:hypothetical protein